MAGNSGKRLEISAWVSLLIILAIITYDVRFARIRQEVT